MVGIQTTHNCQLMTFVSFIFLSGSGQLCDQGGNRFQYHIDNTQRYEGIATVSIINIFTLLAKLVKPTEKQLAQVYKTAQQ